MTTLSGSPLYFMKGFDDYISQHAAHDQDRPGGPSDRVEYMSTVGDCAPKTFVGDVLRTALSYGKADLEIDAYSYVLSHAHEELDPGNDFHGWIAHQLAREWVAEAFPGRQSKIVTQRDNGRWEGEGDERRWVDGHWHSHIIVANVAEQEVSLQWIDAKGVEKTKHYKAGRAIDGDLKNIFRLRHVTDEVIRREWQYDNSAYVEECRRFSEGAASKQDYAQRAERGYSSYDEVRLKLRTAAAQSTTWDDFVTRCQVSAVDVKTRGKAGVSYAWVGDDGLERKARARGKTGVGPEFTRAEIEKQCAANAAILERGDALEIPPQELVVLSSTVTPDRPRPQYQTADGKPPWENAESLTAYEARVRATGGTYEDRATRALVTGEPAEGVELARKDTTVVATVDAGDGAVVFDVDAALAERVAEIDALRAEADGRMGEAEAAANEAKVLRSSAQTDRDAAAADREAAALERTTAEQNAVAAATARRSAEDHERATAEEKEKAEARTGALDRRERQVELNEAAVKRGQTENAEVEDRLATERADLDRRWDELDRFDADAARDGMNRWVISAMRQERDADGVTALDKYLDKAGRIYSEQKRLGRRVNPRETEGERRAYMKKTLDRSAAKTRDANAKQQGADDSYGLG